MNTTVRTLMRLQSLEAYGTSEGVKKEWDSRGRKQLSVPDQHQIKIAQRTLKMNDAMANVMGGMTKDEARAILKKHGIAFDEETKPKFGEGGKSRPAWGYGGDDSGEKKEKKPKFGEGGKSRPSWGYSGE